MTSVKEWFAMLTIGGVGVGSIILVIGALWIGGSWLSHRSNRISEGLHATIVERKTEGTLKEALAQQRERQRSAIEAAQYECIAKVVAAADAAPVRTGNSDAEIEASAQIISNMEAQHQRCLEKYKKYQPDGWLDHIFG